MKRQILVWSTLIAFEALFLSACGTAPPVYESGVPKAAQGGPTSQTGNQVPSKAAPAAGTPTAKTPVAPATAKPAPAATPAAPAATPAVSPAQLIAQGTTIFTTKCASCHGAIAQKAADPRVNLKTAAQLTAAKTTKPVPHGAVIWPIPSEILALEAALK